MIKLNKVTLQHRVKPYTKQYIENVAETKGLTQGQAIDLIVSQCKIKVN